MNLVKTGKKVTIRPMTINDFENWKHSQFLQTKKSKNRWDTTKSTTKIPSKLDYKSVIKKQNDNIKKDKFYDFGIFLKDGKLIGKVSIMDISRGLFQNAYIGYRIYSDFWGNGYGKEAVVLALKIAFKELKLHRIEAGIEPYNKRSIALAKSCGFKKEGYSPKRLYLNGKWVGLSLFVIHSEDLKINCNPIQI